MSGTIPALGVIAGSGASTLLPDMGKRDRLDIDTPYGLPSAPLIRTRYHGMDVYVLNRHGLDHVIPPHRINYRANIWSLTEMGCQTVIAIATVGGIRADLERGDLLLPDQIIDYTWGRDATFFDGVDSGGLGHLETADPYCLELREVILQAANSVGVSLHDGGVYAATQGPRFETAAEVNRIERDGGDVVGMTGMPEAVLASEQRICYACINLIVNPAAGRSEQNITMDEIRQSWAIGCQHLRELLDESIRLISQMSPPQFALNSQVMEI